ncbi:serine/arginine repetitive matrix protein 2-like isoform X2 [Mizuhopecten yessoensis]|uniref:serine/arginine repetitive matrix protein 2-like isoform X2 n=1 Tax=Mizuhopecten yessoensis TaxID=6573 RepID=UPI000B45CA9E|nr:serine/arginine repetitive matrix protein 2-like isoform X2 [Mizuhopecten yessoensis]
MVSSTATNTPNMENRGSVSTLSTRVYQYSSQQSSACIALCPHQERRKVLILEKNSSWNNHGCHTDNFSNVKEFYSGARCHSKHRSIFDEFWEQIHGVLPRCPANTLVSSPQRRGAPKECRCGMGPQAAVIPLGSFDVYVAKESHQLAEATLQKNARLKEAFGISDQYVDGSSFDPDRKTKEEAAKALAMAQKKYSIVRDSSSSERSISPPPKRKKKSKSRDDSSSPERRQKKKKSKKHKRDRESSHSQKRSKKRRRRRSPSSSSDSRSASPLDSDSSAFDGEKVKLTEKSKKSSSSPIHLPESLTAKRITRSRSKSPKVTRSSVSFSSDSSRSPSPRKKTLKTNGHNTATQHKHNHSSSSSRSPDPVHKRLSRSLSYSPTVGPKTKESVPSPKLPYKSPSPVTRHSRPSRSRSQSRRHKSSSWSRSRSRSKSSSRSRSRTHSRNRKRRSRSYSKSRSRSRSRSRRRNYSRSASRSRSRHRMSRSPSIRRRKGSPSHLEKRRITRTQLCDSDRVVQSCLHGGIVQDSPQCYSGEATLIKSDNLCKKTSCALLPASTALPKLCEQLRFLLQIQSLAKSI